MGPNINCFIIIFLSLAAVFLSKLQQRTAMKIIQCWSYSLFAYFSFIYGILNSLYLRWYSKFLSYINAISLSNLYVSSIYNNTGSVLILQLILGNWSFTFSQCSCFCFGCNSWDLHTLWFWVLDKNFKKKV